MILFVERNNFSFGIVVAIGCKIIFVVIFSKIK